MKGHYLHLSLSIDEGATLDSAAGTGYGARMKFIVEAVEAALDDGRAGPPIRPRLAKIRFDPELRERVVALVGPSKHAAGSFVREAMLAHAERVLRERAKTSKKPKAPAHGPMIHS